MRRLDIGIASYGAHDKLRRCLASILTTSATDFRVFVIDNPGPDPLTRKTIEQFASEDRRILPVFLDDNVGYAGAVNELFRLADTEYIAYLDNDVRILTPGWDETLCGYLDRFHEIGMVFPNGENPIYPIERGAYTEVMWGVGFAWIVSRMAKTDTGFFDERIGHQNECDWCLRLRMAGYRCAAVRGVHVQHDATATSNPASIERINRGVVDFVDKWNRYFNGKRFGYHSPNVTRWEDWPPNALYLEEYWLQRFPQLNTAPDVITSEGREYDLIRVPRFKDFYRGRII